MFYEEEFKKEKIDIGCTHCSISAIRILPSGVLISALYLASGGCKERF
jgi:hypothetical protein